MTSSATPIVYVSERVWVPDQVICARPEALCIGSAEGEEEGNGSGATNVEAMGAKNKASVHRTSKNDDGPRCINWNLLQSLFKGSLPCEGPSRRAGSPKSRFQMVRLMPEAFVLFKTEPTHEREVYLALADHEGVAEVHALYGEFDLLVRISAPDSKELSGLLMGTFRRIAGVKETQTLIAVEG
jgi:DNA-binding Lrp family transcriptional regulator